MMTLHVFLIFSAFAFGGGAQVKETWRVGNFSFKTEVNRRLGIMVNPACAVDRPSHPCGAIVFAKRASKKALSKEELSGGKNPGAVLCHRSDGSRVVIAEDPNGNQASFCVFKDGSLISSSSLLKMALRNDLGGKGR